MTHVAYAVLALLGLSGCDAPTSSTPPDAALEAGLDGGASGGLLWAQAWLTPDLTTDFDGQLQIAIRWQGLLSDEERASVETLYLFDAAGTRLAVDALVTEGDPLTAGDGLATLHFAATEPLAPGWYVAGARFRGRLAVWAGATGAYVDVLTHVHVGSAPVIAQARYCRGRGAGEELHLDFSEPVASAGVDTSLSLVIEPAGADAGCGRDVVLEPDGSISAAIFFCPLDLILGGARVVVVDGITSPSGVPLDTAVVPDLSELASMTIVDVGCELVPSRLAAGVVATTSLDGVAP